MYNHLPEGDKNTTKMSEIKLQVGKTYQLIKDWYHSKTGVSLMHDPSLISLVNEIEALGIAHVSKSLPIKKYDIDFDGKVLAGIEISENIPKVFGAIDGYGDGISIEKIKITERGGDVC